MIDINITTVPMTDISIIIPVLNEEENILPLALELTDVFEDTPYKWECIWVDDGSTDRTADRLEHIADEDRRHRYLILEKHSGQSSALQAGFQAALGTIICTLDGDGQNDPADLPVLIELLECNHADLIAGYRVNRQDTWLKKLSSRIGNTFRSFTTGYTVRDTGCSTRVMRKSSLMTLPSFSGMHRFFPTLFVMMGYRIIEAPVHHRARLKGRSKYGIWNRFGAGLLDCFGVLWLKKRTLTYKVVKSSDIPHL
jgi:dolichol-phosphate mannosyltransferase